MNNSNVLDARQLSAHVLDAIETAAERAADAKRAELTALAMLISPTEVSEPAIVLPTAPAATMMGIAPVTLLRATRRVHDPAPCQRFGRSVRFELGALREWAARQPVAPRSKKRQKPIELRASDETDPAVLSGGGMRRVGGER